MTRPRKATVDYFPHSCNHGKTIFILEQDYGNDGYAFWFKLLELLGSSEGHFLDLNEPATAKYLFSKAKITEEIGFEMLNLLASISAIDPELWIEKIVWSEKFVEGVADAYRNRRVEIPKKPDNYRQKPVSNGITDVRNPQMKLDEKKLDEKKKRRRASPQKTEVDAPPFYSGPYFVISIGYREKLDREYPAITDLILLKEISKMEDWLSDNPKPRRANGHLKNPKNFIRNWLEKVIIPGKSLTPIAKPKGWAALKEWERGREGENE